MKKADLRPRDLRIRDKFAGGKTLYEVLKLKGIPDERQLRRIVSKLQNARELEDLDKGRHGPITHRYIPTSDSFGPVALRGSDTPISNKDWDEAIVSIYEAAQDAITSIKASSRCSKPSRIRDVCNKMIKPVIHDVRYLRESNPRLLSTFTTGPFKQIVLPGEYFNGECDSYLGYETGWKRKLRTKGRKGSLRVRHPSSHEEDDWFYPTLDEWKDYLEFLRYDVQGTYLGYHIRAQSATDNE